jgi:hypothetical protein
LFHPAATSRLHTIQGLLSPCRRPPSREDRAPMPLETARSPARTGCHAPPRRLRGFTPHGAAFSAKRG